MKDSIQLFENAQFGQLRINVNADGEPWFCLVDLCRALDLANPSRVKSTLRQDGVHTMKGVSTTINQYGKASEQEVILNFISEPNFYKCIFQSRKKEAEAFQDWVCGEVLPSIRKNGGYMVAKQDETPEEIMARALMVAQATIDRQKAQVLEAEKKAAQLDTVNKGLSKQVEGLERSNAHLRPGATFAKAVETSEHSILVGELARIIKQNGVEIGQNRLFSWLRDNGYLCKKGEMYNQPTQKALGMGLFEIKKTVITKPNGNSLVTTTTKVTGKGQIYFVNKFLFDTINTEEGNGTTATSSTYNEKGGKA